MRACPSCGSENSPESRFCSACGEPLPAQVAERELRKTVTVVFTDVCGSTSLGDRLDAESLRNVMSRYYEAMRTTLERHGGKVAKFIGDAVMAVFGVRVAHEDDALRAVRAAAEMEETLGSLNAELKRRWDLELRVRTGVNTGEVVAGDATLGGALVVGDAVNVAARLEQSAQPGEVLLGPATYALVRDAVHVELVELDLKGKPRSVRAYRLVDVAKATPGIARRMDSPVVGREDEFAVLDGALARLRAEQTCSMVAIVGAAGVGKSRLVGEFSSQARETATVLTGHCLPYGEGITMWPVVEVIKEAAGIAEDDGPDEAMAKIGALLPPGSEDADLIVERVAGAIGLTPLGAQPEQTFWAIRKVLEAVAARSPLVVVFDDVHWAAPSFLDLIEYLTGFTHRAPILIVCVARPELIEVRPHWATPGEGAWHLEIEPLGEQDSARLIANLLGGGDVSVELCEKIAQAAAGNPLFIEEYTRMLGESGLIRVRGGRWRKETESASLPVPPTIDALLSARLDQLSPEERALIECASAIGRVFWQGAVQELTSGPDGEGVGPTLRNLARKELIRPHPGSFAGEAAYSFSHILIRDVAYERLLNRDRAQLHERFARWLAVKAGDRILEYEEILGFHLEQAYRAQRAVGAGAEVTGPLARRSSSHLASAGGRALARGDMPAAVNLLERALGMLPEDDAIRLELLLSLAAALEELGELTRAETVLAGTIEAARSHGDVRLEHHALIGQAFLRFFTDREATAEQIVAPADRAIPVFEQFGDDFGLARAWRLKSTVPFLALRHDAATEALETALEHAQRVGDEREAAEIFLWLSMSRYEGRTKAAEAIEASERFLAWAKRDRSARATHLYLCAGFAAMEGRFAEARELCERARSIYEELGLRHKVASASVIASDVEMLAGNPAAAEVELRAGLETLLEMGERAMLPTVAARLAEVLELNRRDRQARKFALVSEHSAASGDVMSEVCSAATRARVLAREGNFGEAREIAVWAVCLAETTDALNLLGNANLALGQVAAAAGLFDEATEALLHSIDCYEQKGNQVAGNRARARLAQLSEDAASPALTPPARPG